MARQHMEVEILRKLLAILVVLGAMSLPALAGPNQNGVIVVHNTGIGWSADLPLPPVSPVPACADIVNEIPMGAAPGDSSAALVWKVYAAFPPGSSPRLMSCAWGIGLTSDGGGRIVIQGSGAPTSAVFAITTAGWPGDSTFIGMAFTDNARFDPVDELFWFGGYAYAGAAGEPQTFCVIPHSVEANRFFMDDAVPSNADPIAGYGCLGFGQPGDTPCPTPAAPGACCFPNGDCTMSTAADCQTAGGSFVGGDCIPNPCPPAASYGACCVNYVCSLVTSATCAAIGGAYYGDNTVCTPSTCPPPPPPTGANDERWLTNHGETEQGCEEYRRLGRDAFHDLQVALRVDDAAGDKSCGLPRYPSPKPGESVPFFSLLGPMCALFSRSWQPCTRLHALRTVPVDRATVDRAGLSIERLAIPARI